MSSDQLAVTLPDWEGPLDLLLHVIRSNKLDILDIPIAFVTEQYLTFLDTMRALNLDIAGEYLEMAATLVQLKSRMMLPQSDEPEEEENQEPEADPREELVRRLLEYQRYKDAAEKLGGAPLLGRDTFSGGADIPIPEGEEGPLAELGLFDLAEAFRRILARSKHAFTHEVDIERITVSERIAEISDVLREGSLTQFDELFHGEPNRFDIVITLLALLEMTKLKMTRLFQASPQGPLYVTLGGSRADSLGLDAIPGAQYQRALNGGRAWRWQSTRTSKSRRKRPLPRTVRLLEALRMGQQPESLSSSLKKRPTRRRPMLNRNPSQSQKSRPSTSHLKTASRRKARR